MKFKFVNVNMPHISNISPFRGSTTWTLTFSVLVKFPCLLPHLNHQTDLSVTKSLVLCVTWGYRKPPEGTTTPKRTTLTTSFQSLRSSNSGGDKKHKIGVIRAGCNYSGPHVLWLQSHLSFFHCLRLLLFARMSRLGIGRNSFLTTSVRCSSTLKIKKKCPVSTAQKNGVSIETVKSSDSDRNDCNLSYLSSNS